MTRMQGHLSAFLHHIRLAREVVRRGLKRLAFVGTEVTGAIADTDAAIEALKNRGSADEIVYRQNFASDHADFRSAVAVIKQRRPDGVVVVLLPGALSSFARQFRDAKVDAELIGIETFEDEAEVKAARGALQGAWYVNAADSTGTFIADYRLKYNEYPGWGAANAFDTVSLIAKAVSEVGQSSRAIRDYLRTVKNYAGATGVFSASGDNRFTLPAAVKRVTEHGFEVVTPSATYSGSQTLPAGASPLQR
jgi:ABC-type branched-subunit amino acid transport system substrate-binding protein